MHIMHNYLQYLNHFESSAETPFKWFQNTLKKDLKSIMEIYLISSTKYKTYRTIQMDSLGLYFAKQIIL